MSAGNWRRAPRYGGGRTGGGRREEGMAKKGR